MHSRANGSRSRPPRKDKVFRSSRDEPLQGDKVWTSTISSSSRTAANGHSDEPPPPPSSASTTAKGSLTSRRFDSFSNRSRSRDAFRSGRDEAFVRRRGASSPPDGGAATNSGKGERESRPNSSSTLSSSSSPAMTCREGGGSSSTKKTRPDHAYGFTDDPRLSKLTHRILRDDDHERRLPSYKQLKEFVAQPENWKSVARNSERLLSILEGIIKEKVPSDVRNCIVSCMGTIGYVMSCENENYRYFEWMFDKYLHSNNDDQRILLLNAVVETVKADTNKHKLDEFMPMLMNNMQSVLENADVPELLTAIMDVILLISNKFPDIFEAHFRDTVDILVGWHIDTTQNESVTQLTSDALVSFNQFWIADINFSFTLLGQFLEDIEAYSEELTLPVDESSDGDQLNTSARAIKITSLIKVYTTVIRSLGDYLNPETSSAITHEFLSENMGRLVKSVVLVSSTVPTEAVFIAANDCVCLLMTYLKMHSSPLTLQLLMYIEKQTSSEKFVSNVHLSSLLQLLITIIREVNNQFPLECLDEIMGEKSLFPKLRFMCSHQVQQQFLQLYRSIFTLKNVPLLEEAYRFVTGDIHASFRFLLQWELNLPFNTRSFANVTEAEATIIFSLCTIAEVGNAKNSLLGMWALNPSIVDLLSRSLRPMDKVLAQKFPALQYAILFTLYSHCLRSKPGDLAANGTPLLAMVHSVVPTTETLITSGHFETILKILGEILEFSGSSFDIRMLALKWSQELFDSSQPFLLTCSTSSNFNYLVQSVIVSAFSTEKQICKTACSCLSFLMKKPFCLTSAVLKRCLEVCILKIMDIDNAIRELFLELLCQLPLDVTTASVLISEKGRRLRSIPTGLIPEHVSSLNAVWLARRNFTSRAPLGTFHLHNFRSVMAFILQGAPLDILHLVQMFLTCQRAEKMKSEDRVYNSLTVNNESLLWFWATWEAAQFCVLSKLRTSFGKPQETFTTIEAAIKTLLLEAKLNHDEQKDLKNTTGKELDFTGPLQTHLRAKLLLDFVEHLEKLMYNAYEGCATAMPGAPKAVKTFFRTNKATCLEWLTRIRMAVLLLALHMGNPALAVRQGYQLLSDMKDASLMQGSEFEHIVMNIVHALIDLHSPEAILGIYVWCKETVGRKFTWMKAAVEQANRRYETAACEFICLIKNHQSMITNKMHNLSSSQEESSDESSDDNGEDEVISDKPSQVNKRHGSLQEDPDLPIITFMSNQVIESYRRLNSWVELVRWAESQQQSFHEQNGNIPRRYGMAIDLSYLSTLSKFEDLDPGLLKSESLLLHDKTEETLQKLMVPFPQRMLQEADVALMTAAIKWDAMGKINNDDQKKLSHLLTKASQYAGGPLRVAAMDWPPRLPAEHMALYHISNTFITCLPNENKSTSFCASTKLDLDLLTADCGTWNQVLRWSKQIEQLEKTDNNSCIQTNMLDNLYLSIARLARKHRNLKLAQKLFLQHIKRNIDVDWKTLQSSLEVKNSWVAEVLHHVQSREASTMMIQLQREGAKLLYSLGYTHQAVDILVQTVNVSFNISKSSTAMDQQPMGEMSARSLLTLVKWIQADSQLMNSNVNSLLTSQNHVLKSSSFSHLCNLKYLSNNSSSGDVDSGEDMALVDAVVGGTSMTMTLVTDIEMSLGHLLCQCTVHCPTLAKAWASLGSWLYKWGRKAVDVTSEKSIDLLPDEWNKIMCLLPKETSEDEINAITEIISRTYCVADGDFTDTCGDGDEMIRRHLLAACPRLHSVDTYCMDGLVNVWRGIVDRIYSFYKLSAEAYFKCLMLSEPTTNEAGEQPEDTNIMATLRLLRLVVKHASELREVLEEGLAHTPTGPWKGIIPQLFARLNHPETYVRQSISDLLCRVAHAAPHLIVFAAVVGSSAIRGEIKDSTVGVLGQYLSQSSDDESEDKTDDASQEGDIALVPTEEDQQKAAIMRNCFAAMVETLSKQDPRSISEVQMFVQELRRITLLWDEFWVGTLNQYHADFNRKISQLENEVKKVLNNASLSSNEKALIIQRKHATILKPTLFVLEQLHQITSQPPETPHEVWFQEIFGRLIEDTIYHLKNPSDPSQPQTSWQHYKQLLQTLQHRAQKRSSLILNMEQVSPTLANLRSTVICIPGAQTKGNHTITIESIDHTISILPTKTKPKKLIFHGSDGCKYIYLFKGLEDLHLDERIMQFISIINSMFVRNKRQGKVIYCARHYSVTPLGPRSGLIQWVDGATPLFGLYKRWQQREAVAQAQKMSSGNIASGVPSNTTPRPSDIYYSKLTPLLKEKGITNLDKRREWPLSVLRQVLLELMEETPKDLLAKELWCSSSSAAEWWKITETYSQSTAVMSMIGYIIGLGDRHLDNVLVDLASGEVVHIDYNVCFEKGKNLRVPEKVPFRMTPNIETALGATGIEGIFRVSCEHVIKTMRRGRETLLTLLEAFVYDPLIDWTPGGEGGYTGAVYGGGQLVAMENRQSKLDMEMEITYSMFSIRIAEMKADWIKNRDELLESLPLLEKHLQSWITMQKNLLAAEEVLQEHHTQMAYLKEAEANPAHTLYFLHQRYSEYVVVKSAVNAAKELAQEKLNECERWHNLHEVTLHAVTGAELSRWYNEAAKNINFSASFAPVIDFLHTAGQSQLLGQCEQVDNDLASLLHQHQSILRSCLDALTTYATIVVQFPPSYLKQNRSYKWQQWLVHLTSNFLLTECQEIINKFHTEYGLDCLDVNLAQTVLTVEYQLQSIIADINANRIKLYERIQMEGLDNAAQLASNTEESRQAIQQFIRDHNKSGINSFKYVLLTSLCSLNKRCLMLEGAAFAAEDRLVNFTLREGDWFLDEVYSISNNVMELLLLLKNNCQITSDGDPDISKAFEGVTAIHHVVQSLQDLHLNFLTIILPEALKHIQSEERSVNQALQMLTSLILQVGMPLDMVINQLEIHMRSVVLEMDSPNSEAVALVNHLRNEFSAFVKPTALECNLSPGQMLFMGFNGLFTKLEEDFLSALGTLKLLVLPMCWKKVDLVKEAKALLAPVFLDSALAVLRDIFFIKRLQAMQDFFALAQQHSHSLLIGTLTPTLDPMQYSVVYNDNQLTQPIKRFIAEFVRKQMVGLLSQSLCHMLCLCIRKGGVDVTAEIELRDVGAESKVSLEELCRKGVDLALKEDMFKQSQLNHATMLVANFEQNWKKQDVARRLEQTDGTLKTSLQRLQLQLTSHQWLHEDILLNSPVSALHNMGGAPSRANVMSEMRKSMQALLSIESSLVGTRDRYHNLVSSVEQRLKWAVGANPSVTNILEEFGQSVASRSELITTMTKVGGEVTTTCSTILHFEALRTRTSEAISSDSGFLQLINQCQESCLLAENCKTSVTQLEEKLVDMKSMEGQAVTKEWIMSLALMVTEATNKVQGLLADRKLDVYCTTDIIKNQVINIRGQLGTHHHLMTDIRTILKSMAKYEEQNIGCYIQGVKQYMQDYKNYSEKFTNFIREVLTEELNIERLQNFAVTVSQLYDETGNIYENVVQFALPLTSMSLPIIFAGDDVNDKLVADSGNHLKEDPTLGFGSLRIAASPRKHLSIGRSELFSGTSPASQNINRSSGLTKKSTVTRDPRTGKALQERNSYAVNVWRRVKMKLDGRDPDINRRSSVAEQVDFVLQEATNLDNLAVLYEGWTPWV